MLSLCWVYICRYFNPISNWFSPLARHPLAWAAVAAGHFRQPDRLSLLDEHQHLCKLFRMPLLKYVEIVQHIAAWKDTKNHTTLSNHIFEHHWSIGSAAPQATKNTKTGARFSPMRPAFDEGRLRPGSKLRKGMGKEWSCRGNYGKSTSFQSAFHMIKRYKKVGLGSWDCGVKKLGRYVVRMVALWL